MYSHLQLNIQICSLYIFFAQYYKKQSNQKSSFWCLLFFLFLLLLFLLLQLSIVTFSQQDLLHFFCVVLKKLFWSVVFRCLIMTSQRRLWKLLSVSTGMSWCQRRWLRCCLHPHHQRFNALNIQMLTEMLHKQIFPSQDSEEPQPSSSPPPPSSSSSSSSPPSSSSLTSLSKKGTSDSVSYTHLRAHET